MNMKPLIAANWKMNGSLAVIEELLGPIKEANTENADILICPPAPYLLRVQEALKGSALLLGAQDCHTEKSGAYTGEISPLMIRDCGGSHVILGHSERRLYQKETSDLVQKKAQAALAGGLIPIICIGETEQERDSGEVNNIIKNQIINSVPQSKTLIIAYEPVWAIGTGRSANATQILEMHAFIRDVLEELGLSKIPILYGGSVKGENAASILSLKNVSGALVGGASLKAAEFLQIHAAAK